jgi:predicted transposase YbfD/YdcC
MGESARSLLGTFGVTHGIASMTPLPVSFSSVTYGVAGGVAAVAAGAAGVPGDYVHLDGKTLRGTRCQQQVKSAACGECGAGITLGQVAVAAKSMKSRRCRVTQTPDLHEKIVTTDAMGCQRRSPRRSWRVGDSSWRSKTISPSCTELQAACAGTPPPSSAPRGSRPPLTGTDARAAPGQRCPRASLCPPPKGRCGWGACGDGHPGSVVSGDGAQTRRSVTSVVCSQCATPWARDSGALGIENGLHWVLDVAAGRPRRVYDRTTAEKCIHEPVGSQHGDTSKDSMKVKRKQAGWSIPYLAQLLGFHST